MSGESRLTALDGIRGVAIVVVIVFHTTSISRFPLQWLGIFATPVVHGWLGVDLFFAMSGFLITRLWLEEEATSPSETAGSRARRFYARRSLRILPLYYFTLAGFLVAARFVQVESIAPFARRVAAAPTTLGPYLLFFVNYVPFGKDGAFAARWSLCVEEHFYLLWPSVLLAVRSRRGRIVTALVVNAGVLAARWVGVMFADHRHGWASSMMVRYASHLRIDTILWGCLAALVYENLVPLPRRRRLLLGALGALVVLFMVSDEITVLAAPTAWGVTAGSLAIAAGAALLSLEVTAAPRSWLARMLSVPPLPAIGYHSYAMYLLHPVAIDAAVGLMFQGARSLPLWRWVLRWALTVALAIAFALAASFVLHVTFERPFRRLRLRLRRTPLR